MVPRTQVAGPPQGRADEPAILPVAACTHRRSGSHSRGESGSRSLRLSRLTFGVPRLTLVETDLRSSPPAHGETDAGRARPYHTETNSKFLSHTVAQDDNNDLRQSTLIRNDPRLLADQLNYTAVVAGLPAPAACWPASHSSGCALVGGRAGLARYRRKDQPRTSAPARRPKPAANPATSAASRGAPKAARRT